MTVPQGSEQAGKGKVARGGDMEGVKGFSHALYERIQGSVMTWLSSIRGGFIIEALVKTPGVGPKVVEELQPRRAQVRDP